MEKFLTQVSNFCVVVHEAVMQAADEYKYHSFKEKDPNADAVQIMTVHKAKGLEYHTVFLPELIKREFPVSNMGGKKYWHVLGGVFEANKNKYQSDIEDERKLFYVAVTRAKKNLYLSYELSNQPVSCFVAEASDSHYVEIDRSDLTYRPKVDTSEFVSKYSIESVEKQKKWTEEKEEQQCQMQEYWELVKYAKSQLYSYYGTACHYFPAARADLMKIKSMSPEEILDTASRSGLI